MNLSQRLEELREATLLVNKLQQDLSKKVLNNLSINTELDCVWHVRYTSLSFSIWEYPKGVRDIARFSYQDSWVVVARGTFDDNKVEGIRLVLEELMLEGKNDNTEI